VAWEFSNAETGNIYYKAHVEYLQHVVGVVRKGGSAILEDKFGSTAIAAASKYPEEMFHDLDQEWQELAEKLDAGKTGFTVPPVLAIVLTRCSKREQIPFVIKDLKEEWAHARRKVWDLLDRLRNPKSVAEASKITKELEEASKLMAFPKSEKRVRSVRVLWNLVVAGGLGSVASLVSSGEPLIGAATAVLGATAPYLCELGPTLFGRGAFDLSRRVRREALRVEYDALSKLLTDSEKRSLGL